MIGTGENEDAPKVFLTWRRINENTVIFADFNA
jgi:hypothetical protein